MRPLSKTLLKVLLIWLVALAVPVQAFAASARWGCSAGHATGPASQLPPCHQAAAPTRPAQAQTESPQSKQPDGGQHACSACAACFIGAALLPSVPRLVLAEAAVAVAATARVTVADFTTGGPDRPPRAALG